MRGLGTGAHIVCLAERIAEEQVAGATDERERAIVVGEKFSCWESWWWLARAGVRVSFVVSQNDKE